MTIGRYQRVFVDTAPLRALRPLGQYIVPALISCLLLGSAFLPWLKDPLGASYPAWQLPINIGWFQFELLNYGALCIFLALFLLFRIYRHWEASHNSVGGQYVLLTNTVAFLCFTPILLFALQYLFVNLHDMNVMANHENQWLLIRRHFGYVTPAQLIPQQAFTVSGAVLQGRLNLLIDQAGLGLLLALVAGLLALFNMHRPAPARRINLKRRWPVALAISALSLVIFGRAPASALCDYQAKQYLAVGAYSTAASWLDAAFTLNPDLAQSSSYHIERGRIRYYLHPGDLDDDAHVYLAFVYRNQGDYIGAYQQLNAVWRSHNNEFVPWITDELAFTLQWLSEYSQQNKPTAVERAEVDSASLPWLENLSNVDDTNVYSQYMSARIYYIQHAYQACAESMQNVLAINRDPNIRSSALTYIALSKIQLGSVAEGRQILLQAIALDPYFHNNTAREELSGLH